MSFSLKNGLLMTYAQLFKDGGDGQMWFAVIMFLIPGVYGAFTYKSIWFGIIWVISFSILFILIRCTEDPYELGWLEK